MQTTYKFSKPANYSSVYTRNDRKQDILGAILCASGIKDHFYLPVNVLTIYVTLSTTRLPESYKLVTEANDTYYTVAATCTFFVNSFDRVVREFKKKHKIRNKKPLYFQLKY